VEADATGTPRFDLFSPTDYRYPVEALKPYLSEEAFIRYKARVEGALAEALAEYGLCPKSVAEEIRRAASEVTAEEVYREEARIRHDIRALVNAIRGRVGDGARPFVHATATSYDIVDTANVLRYREAARDVILPDMVALERAWIDLARRERDTVQIGRTHGQHAEPITFGFAVAQYVNRWGNRIIKVKEATENLVGKFSGAVGAYNASSLFLDDPEGFERKVLERLGLRPAEASTQIVPPEPVTDFIHSIVSSLGVLANFARDMRGLQRSEIGEVGEPFGEEQVGSSAMPHKRNPVNFENVESMWKRFLPHMVTMYLDQVSEHQRDLTNSCSQRYTPELLVAFDSSVRRMTEVSRSLEVDQGSMRRNLEQNRDKVAAEPLSNLLSFHGHPDAHEHVRRLTMESYRTGVPLTEIALADRSLQPYLKKLTRSQLKVVSDPSRYVGIAAEKAEKVAALWEERLERAGLWR